MGPRPWVFTRIADTGGVDPESDPPTLDIKTGSCRQKDPDPDMTE